MKIFLFFLNKAKNRFKKFLFLISVRLHAFILKIQVLLIPHVNVNDFNQKTKLKKIVKQETKGRNDSKLICGNLIQTELTSSQNALNKQKYSRFICFFLFISLFHDFILFFFMNGASDLKSVNGTMRDEEKEEKRERKNVRYPTLFQCHHTVLYCRSADFGK